MQFPKRYTVDGFIFALVFVLYFAGQLFIGTYHPEQKRFYFDTPADVDFLYYAGIIEQMKHAVPPQNPAFGGATLSQSFVQYYPLMIASLVTGPYPAMRLMNIVYLALLAFVLRRYFPRGWGVGTAIITAGSVGFGLINALGIDLIARGFNHFPFFIALIIALFERKNKWLRYGSLFLLGWLHSFSALLVLIYLGFEAIASKFKTTALIDTIVCLAGVGTAAAITMGVADKPFYFPFVEGFGFDLTHLWMHLVPVAVLAGLANKRKIYIFAGTAAVFGLLFHYNPFFPVFLLYFAAGWAAMEILAVGRYPRAMAYAVAGVLMVGFVFNGVTKYNPTSGSFYPHLDPDYGEATAWVAENTPPDAVFMAISLEPGWTNRLMEKRAMYLGYIPHVSHLGIDWRNRAQKIVHHFRNPAVYMAETDYVMYGPVERKLFPGYSLEYNPVFQKGDVTIWKIKR